METETKFKKEIEDLTFQQTETVTFLKSEIDQLQQELEDQEQSNQECIQFHNQKIEEMESEILKLKGDHAVALSKAYLDNYME